MQGRGVASPGLRPFLTNDVGTSRYGVQGILRTSCNRKPVRNRTTVRSHKRLRSSYCSDVCSGATIRTNRSACGIGVGSSRCIRSSVRSRKSARNRRSVHNRKWLRSSCCSDACNGATIQTDRSVCGIGVGSTNHIRRSARSRMWLHMQGHNTRGDDDGTLWHPKRSTTGKHQPQGPLLTQHDVSWEKLLNERQWQQIASRIIAFQQSPPWLMCSLGARHLWKADRIVA